MITPQTVTGIQAFARNRFFSQLKSFKKRAEKLQKSKSLEKKEQSKKNQKKTGEAGVTGESDSSC